MSLAKRFTPRFLSAPEYVLALHAPKDHIAVLARNRERRQTVQRILPAETVANPSFQRWLTDENVAGADIFIGMNPVNDGAHNRTKEHIREIRHAYLDLDEEAGAFLRAIRASGDIPSPNFVLDTSTGKHQVVWSVEGLEREQAESLLRGLASQFGGDPAATDISRLLRLPGFKNQKYNDTFLVRVHHETNQVHRPEDFRIPESSPESPRQMGDSTRSGRMMSSDHKSQSEADWAYAKRALARGDDPEVVIHRIADFRSEDKSDPMYYAHLTVTKAQAQLYGPEAGTTIHQSVAVDMIRDRR
jgi:DNA primase RepB-like protein